VCREANLTPPRFYRVFKNLEGFCERAGIKIDRETLVRIKGTMKATKRRTRKKRPTLHRDSNPAMVVEGESPKQQAAPTFEEIQQNLKDEEEARQQRLENIGKFVAQIEILALDGDPKISGPVIDALSSVIPTVLEKKFGVEATLKDLIEANDVLHQAQKERKKLRSKEIQLDGYAKKVQADWEKLRADSDKGALFQRVESLEAERRVLTSQVNEARIVYENYRRVFSGFCATVFKCKACGPRFLGYMESYPEANAWLLKGDWRKEKLKFLES
jgi:peptide subunit release factor RF-3